MRTRQQRDQQDHRHDGEVLGDADAERLAAVRRTELAVVDQDLADRRGARQADQEAEEDRLVETQPERQTDAGTGDHGADDLQAAEQEDGPAHARQLGQRHLETDREQQHDDPDLGQFADHRLVAHEADGIGADQHAGDQEADDRRQPEAVEGHRDADAQGEQQRQFEQDLFEHGTELPRQPAGASANWLGVAYAQQPVAREPLPPHSTLARGDSRGHIPVRMTSSFLAALGIGKTNSGAFDGTWRKTKGDSLVVRSPIDGKPIATVALADAKDYAAVSAAAHAAFLRWRELPAPKRGEYVRRIGEAFRAHKEDLGKLVALEAGKILQEGLGEAQECIDIADFALGLSRQLYGLTIASERPQHSMRETWHPLGTVGIITAFNFPIAVWAWNAMLALVCGDSCLWKPSLKTPLTAIAMTRIAAKVLGKDYAALVGLVIGPDLTVGSALLDDPTVPLVSATGSTRMGRIVGPRVAQRFGRTLLELGGNNSITVLADADLSLAVRAIVFGAVGTAGQRCTTTRRLFVHASIVGELTKRLVKAYGQCTIGNPLDKKTLVGPLVDEASAKAFDHAVAEAKAQGGKVLCGGKRAKVKKALAGGAYVEPTIVLSDAVLPVSREETFAPILYVVPVQSVEEAIAKNNDVPQGLSSAIFTSDVRASERFLSAIGSDCGIANVNIGTSGAEIGGAFGGEKETGGGRESGSDSWKVYMRRQTSTVNWGNQLPLAQGIKFGDG
jgi:aldehyde dehydrogenase (NAD+)